MRIQIDFSALKKTKLYEYSLRFFFGGFITVVAGVLAKLYGPVFGGLFLAFPAIFPASATLIQKHVEEKKAHSGIVHTARGRQAAALDARGTIMGSVGLIGFAIVAWKLIAIWNGAVALFAALVIWLAVSILIWRLRRHRVFFRLRRASRRA